MGRVTMIITASGWASEKDLGEPRALGAAPGTEFSTLGDDWGPVSCRLWEYTSIPGEKQGLSSKTTHGQLQTTKGPRELTMEGF